MIPKLRAWDKANEIYFNHVDIIDFVNGIIICYSANDGEQFEVEFESAVVMQSTGLKDKNGVEIFEGDIISCEIETIEKFIICEQCGCFGIRDKIDGFISLNSINETLSIRKEFEVLGNIFEHPHLLEE